MSAVENLDPASPTRRVCPRERGYPLVGVLPELMKDPLGGLRRIAYQHPGEIVLVHVGPVRAYLVTHPPHVERVLHTHWRNYTKGAQMWRPLRRFLGGGLVTAEGAEWVQARRMMQPIFNHKYIVSLTDNMIATIDRSREQLAERARAGQPVDMYQEMNVITQNVILESVFDVTIERSEAERLGEALANVLRELALRVLLSFMPDSFPLPGERRLRKALAEIDEGLVRLTERWEQKPNKERTSLLGLMRAAKDPETGQGLSAQQVRDQLVTLWSAGNETTATVLSWVWYLLAENPEAEARVRAEVAEVLGDRLPRFEDLERLRYCRQVILESMRLYPPSWTIPRQSVEDDVIDGFFIPKGSLVLTSQYLTQRMPSVWEKPEVFDPDRFSPERSAGRHPYAFLPFGGGPRRCIGEQFGLNEAQLILAMVTQRFRVRLAPGHRVVPLPAMALRPRGPLQMTLEPV